MTPVKMSSKISRPAAPADWAAGPRSSALFEEEQRYIAPGLQSIALFSSLAMDRGRGCRLYDADGREYLDFVAGIAVASVGHAHPDYVRGLSQQLARLNVGSFTTERRLSFVKSLSRVTPTGLSRIQLYCSGAEAVEAALRLAKSRTGNYETVGFWGGFHGKTGGVLGLLGDTSFKHGLGPLAPGLYLSPYPDARRCPFGAEGEHDCAGHCLDFLREMVRRETSGALSAVILEPIQGTAGNILPPPGFFAGVAQITREHGALFISDEMITGFGRTGKWFGCDHEGVVPDIMTVGKGMAGGFPVSGVVTSTELALSKPFANPSGSSSSYGGNPLAAAAADATLSIIQRERLVENAARVGESLLESLRALQARCPLLGNARGRGLLLGVDLVNPKTGEPLEADLCRELFENCLQGGLLTMAYNPSLRINPPLTLSEAEARRGIEILEEALAALRRRHGL